MSDVFLLGAGFSKAISSQMPLLRELSNQVRTALPLLNPPNPTLNDDIEIWLSYLSQSHPWFSEQDTLRNRAAVLDISRMIKAILSKSEQAVIQDSWPCWLRKLTHHWHQYQSNVITLNYDTLVERAAGEPKEGGNRLAYPNHLYPVPLALSTTRSGSVWGSGAIDSFKLFKLHGSINWYHSGSHATTGEVLYYSAICGWGNTSDREVESESHVADKVPLIVPPSTEKSEFFQHESIKHLWTLAGYQIRSSSRIYVIGYSLPATDLTARLFLIEGGSDGNSRKELYIVNPDHTVVSRYRDLLGNTFEIKGDFIGPNAVERFVDYVCQGVNGNEE